MNFRAMWTGCAVGVVAVVALGLPSVALAEGLPDGIEVDGDTIERVDSETGEPRWRVVHASVWRSSKREEQDYELRPVVHDGRLYYGLGSWLLRLDPETGVVERRHYFPANITSVASNGDELLVTVERDGPARDEPFQTQIPFEPGGSTPEQTWNWAPQIAAMKDASLVAAPVVGDDSNVEPTEREEVLEVLRGRRSQDPSNPFYDLSIGRILFEADRSEEAREAFERAVSRERVHWTMLFQLAAHLDDVEHHDLADRAYERAHRQVDQIPYVELRRWPSLVSYAMLLGWSRETVDRAVRKQRPERVDRILGRTAETFPRLEFTTMAWEALGKWFDEQGRGQLASEWRERAERAGESPWPAVEEITPTVDLALALLLGFVVALVGSAFIFGVRRARPGEQRGWLARPHWAEVAGLAVALAVPFALLWIQKSETERIEVVSEIPIEVLNGGWASPSVEHWLEQLEPSPSRDRLLADVREMRRELEEGSFEGLELVAHEDVVGAIGAHSRQVAWQSLVNRAEFELFESVDYRLHPLWMLGGAPGIVVVFLIGGVIAFYVPALDPVIRYGVPGAARSAGFFTPFILAVAVASIGSVAFGLDTILQRIAVPDFGQHFGLQSIVESQPAELTRVRGWVGLSLAAAAHGVTLWLDRRGASSDESDEDSEEGERTGPGN